MNTGTPRSHRFLALFPCTSQSRVERPPAKRFAAVAARLRSVWRRILTTFVGFSGVSSSSNEVFANMSSLVGACGDAGSSFVSVERSRPTAAIVSLLCVLKGSFMKRAAASFGPLSLVASPRAGGASGWPRSGPGGHSGRPGNLMEAYLDRGGPG